MNTKGQGIVPSSLEEDLLTLLNGKSLYGLEIITAVAIASQGKRKLGTGSLYTTLHRLEEKNLINSRWGEDTDGKVSGARRKYYELTIIGKAVLNETNKYRERLANWAPDTSEPSVSLTKTNSEPKPEKV